MPICRRAARLEREPWQAHRRRHGRQAAIVALFDKLPKPTYEQKVDGTEILSRAQSPRHHGVVDPGGNNLTPAD